MFRKVLVFLLFSFNAFAFTIPDNLTQGMLVYGTAKEDEEIFYEDLPVQVYNGEYVFALGRNAPETIHITIKKGWFSRDEHLTFHVTPRKWDTDVIDGVPMRKVKPEKKDKARLAKEQELLDDARAQRPFKDGFPKCFIKPVQETRISTPFGWQRIINGVKQRHHSGVDMACPTGTPVKASADGVVVLAQDDLFYTGGTVLIEHGHGIITGYSHLSKVMAKVGDAMKQGDIVGLSGSTGRSTGPHLHFTLAWNNIRVAPELEYCESCPCRDK